MSDCNFCDDFELLQRATCDEKVYRWNVVKSLCYIIKVLSEEQEAEVPTVTNILPQVVKTAAQIESAYSSAYASVGLINSTLKLNSVRVVNDLDVDLQFSYDGGLQTAFTVLAGTEYKETLNITLATLISFKMQKISGTANTGSVYIEGRYDS